MPTLFSRIYQGEIPGFLITETPQWFVILDKFPVRRGHLLVIPKREVPTIWQLSKNEYQTLWPLLNKLQKALQQVFKVDQVSLSAMGAHIKDHAHIHLIPFSDGDVPELSEGKEVSDDQLKQDQQKLKQYLADN